MNINIEKALLEGGLVFCWNIFSSNLENYFDENELRAKQNRLLELAADLGKLSQILRMIFETPMNLWM